ncbi:MAG: hypothetical protein HRF46_10140 [Acidobacteriota bacterium]|jgi:hypothetical protein
MSGQPSLASVGEILQAIRQGMVPRAVRLFAAQGLLPVSREDLIRIVLLLSAEGDEEIAEQARNTLATFETSHFLALLTSPEIEALDLELLVRSVQAAEVLEAAARHPRVANETLRWLARHAGPGVQDIIITNQARVMTCLEILDDLRANPQVGPDVLRRVREFEEEFLEKAVVWATAGGEPELAAGPSVEEALAELKAIGMRLPGEALASTGLEGELGDEEASREIKDLFVRLSLMNAFQRVMAALKGGREERLILARDRNPLVARAVAMSPKLSEADVERIAQMRQAHEEVLRIFASSPKWLRRYGVVRNLAFNPKTPLPIALNLVNRLSLRDLRFLGRDRNVAATLRRKALARLQEHR